MGNTISLAGMPRINAMRITPSRPKRREKGSKSRAQWVRMLSPAQVTFPKHQLEELSIQVVEHSEEE